MFCCVRRFRSYEELKLLKVCCCSGRRDACSADASSVVRCMLGAAERRGNLFVCLSNADAIPDRSLIIWPLVSDYSALRVSLSGGHHGPPGGPAPTPPPHHPPTTTSSWLRTSLSSWSHGKFGWSSFRLLLICSRGSTCRLLSGSDNPHLLTSRI